MKAWCDTGIKGQSAPSLPPLLATKSESSDLGKGVSCGGQYQGDSVTGVGLRRGPTLQPLGLGFCKLEGTGALFPAWNLEEKLPRCPLHHGSCSKGCVVSGPEACPPEQACTKRIPRVSRAGPQKLSNANSLAWNLCCLWEVGYTKAHQLTCFRIGQNHFYLLSY